MPFDTTTEQSVRRFALSAHPVLKTALVVLAQVGLILAALYVYLDGSRRNFHVPFHFAIDSLVALMQSKSTIDNGWWWFNPRIGAPFGLDELAFPANSNLDQAFVWVVSRFVADAITATNMTWMAMVVVSGVAATWCLTRLGISRMAALAAGTLFALSPYPLYRNIGHFWMVIYLVPFSCTVALLLASGRLALSSRVATVALLVGMTLIGFNYVYYAFFAVFFVAVGTAIGFAAAPSRRILAAGALCAAFICVATVLNLAPSLYSWHRHGKPVLLIMGEKAPGEAELYGLKIRHLVSPSLGHSFGPFRSWVDKELLAHFPIENENRTARLGLVGALGFVFLLVFAFLPHRPGDPMRDLVRGASLLTIAAVLLATVGGLGSLFSLLVSPQIRAYNRIVPFISFFSLAAAAFAIDRLFTSQRLRAIAVVVVLAIGLADQRAAAVDLDVTYPDLAAEMPPLRSFVADLERRLPPDSMVLQLPFRTYLYDGGMAKMQPYEHLKPYLVSRTLRWSYPALSNEQNRWQQAAQRLGPTRLARQIAAENFSAIVVDRFGYGDNGTAITAALESELAGANALLASSDRYVAYDIRSLRRTATGPRLAADPGPSTAAMSACQGDAVVSIDFIGDQGAPFDGRKVPIKAGEGLRVVGWAVDTRSTLPAAGVDIVIDSTPFPSYYGTDRPDVAHHFRKPTYFMSGFASEIPITAVTAGAHTLSIRVAAADGSCYYSSPPIALESR